MSNNAEGIRQNRTIARHLDVLTTAEVTYEQTISRCIKSAILAASGDKDG